jgi:hypothetical protein
LAATSTNTLKASTAASLARAAALGTATEDGATAPTKGALSGGASVVNHGERRFVFGNLDGEEARRASSVYLLVWVTIFVRTVL